MNREASVSEPTRCLRCRHQLLCAPPLVVSSWWCRLPHVTLAALRAPNHETQSCTPSSTCCASARCHKRTRPHRNPPPVRVLEHKPTTHIGPTTTTTTTTINNWAQRNKQLTIRDKSADFTAFNNCTPVTAAILRWTTNGSFLYRSLKFETKMKNCTKRKKNQPNSVGERNICEYLIAATDNLGAIFAICLPMVVRVELYCQQRKKKKKVSTKKPTNKQNQQFFPFFSMLAKCI